MKKWKKKEFRSVIDAFISNAIQEHDKNSKKDFKKQESLTGLSLNVFLGQYQMTQRELSKLINIKDLEYMHEQFAGAYERVMYYSSNPNLKYLHTTLLNSGEWLQIQKLIIERQRLELEKKKHASEETVNIRVVKSDWL